MDWILKNPIHTHPYLKLLVAGDQPWRRYVARNWHWWRIRNTIVTDEVKELEAVAGHMWCRPYGLGTLMALPPAKHKQSKFCMVVTEKVVLFIPKIEGAGAGLIVSLSTSQKLVMGGLSCMFSSATSF